MRFFLIFLLFSVYLNAHQLRENYLRAHYYETNKTLSMVLEIETRLLENPQILDDNKNQLISFKELRAHEIYLTDYMQKNFKLYSGDQKLSMNDATIEFHRYQDQTYMQVRKTFQNIDLDKLTLKYDMFFELESIHKLLIHLDDKRGDYILNKNNTSYSFSSFRMSQAQRIYIFCKSGVLHILDGLDHLLFILMLLIPIAMSFRQTSNNLKSSFIMLLKIITTFSIAHSLSLFASGIGLWTPNIMFIESSIALSVFVVAFMNFNAQYELINKKIVFLFGLLHGFGFANVLKIGKMDDGIEFIVALFGFNLGVELGQIFVVILLIPLLYVLCKSKYCEKLLRAIALIVALICAYWFMQRVGLL